MWMAIFIAHPSFIGLRISSWYRFQMDETTASPRRHLASKPGIRDVARHAGVAVSSASRVLSGRTDVSPAMRAAVLRSAAELDYQPNFLARGLRSRRSMSVGFAVSHIANPVIAEMVEGAESALRTAGYSVLLTSSDGSPDSDARNIELLKSRQVDGLILALAHENEPSVVHVLQSCEMPMVLIDRDRPDGVDAMLVRSDHRAGVTEATNRLLQLGHRDFALIVAGPPSVTNQRRAAVDAALWPHGGRCLVVESGPSHEGAYAAAMTALMTRPRPTALIAAGNGLLVGAIRALHELDLQVGRDISLVGYDNVLVAELHQPPIAIVDRDTAALGSEAARLVLAALGADQPNAVAPADVVLPTSFLDRPSCAAPPHDPTDRDGQP